MLENTDFDEDGYALVMADPVARSAFFENTIRRRLSQVFLASPLTADDWANFLDVPLAQARRLLHEEVGGRLHLTTIVRAADALGYAVEVRLVRRASATKETQQ